MSSSYKIVPKNNGTFVFKEIGADGSTVRLGTQEFETEEDAQEFVDDNFSSKKASKADEKEPADTSKGEEKQDEPEEEKPKVKAKSRK